MKALLDTDILLDVALRRAAFFDASATVMRWAELESGRSAVAWHSLSNIAYLLRPDARPFLRDLLKFAEVPATGTRAAVRALGFPMRDLEDAMQVAAALECGADYVVTRNVAHYRNAPVPAISPAAFARIVAKRGSK